MSVSVPTQETFPLASYVEYVEKGAICPFVMIISGVVLLSLASRLHIPLEPVPVTAQTFAVFLISLTFGCQLAVTSVLSWLMLGVVGAPVLASQACLGTAVLVGPTAGYLAGFIMIAAICGYCAEEKHGGVNSLPRLSSLLLLGNLLLYIPGVCWLSYMSGSWDYALLYGFYLMIPGELVKMLLVILSLPQTWKLIHKS